MDITSMMGVASLAGNGYEPETYMIKFASDGTREGTIPCGRSMTDEEKQELISKGYEEVPASEWQEYCNGKIRGEDGKPVDPPPYVPSKEEKLAALDSQYDSDKDQLAKYYLDAVLSGNEDLQSEIKTELVTLNKDYEAARKEIEGE